MTHAWKVYIKALASLAGRFGPRALVAAFAVAALLAVASVAGGDSRVWAQTGANCDATDIGSLGADDGQLEASGRWTTADCDSRFHSNSDAHTYRFTLEDAGRVRIELSSDGADSYLHLLAEDGSRLADNDDGGAGLDARVERDMEPGVYLVEATTVGGRGRGPAGFRLTVGWVTGCEPVHLGSLERGADLTATGTWTLDTCGSRFVVAHPAHDYLFDLPQGGHVRVDLMSENGDPVLSLVSMTDGLIAANDDGGERRNSRIERYLQPGTYLVEATTYLERDYQPLMADFTLVIHLVDETARQNSFLLKIEDVHTPERVVAGQPFDVHYRVGNLGGGDLAEVGGNAEVYVVGPRVYEYTDPIEASDERWNAGVSYHTGAQTANSSSVEIRELKPFEVTFRSHGPSWIFVAVVTDDEDGEERGFHGQWKNVMVLSGTTFDPVTVSVDGADYTVSATADDEGEVTTSVRYANDPVAAVSPDVEAKALYAAGVLTQKLNGIFQRPAIAALPTVGSSESVSLADPTSDELLKAFGQQYASALRASGLHAAYAGGEAVNPVAVEDLLLDMAKTASARAVSLAASWAALQDGLDDGEALSFADAFDLHTQLAYAESVLSPLVSAGAIVEAARAADNGWDAPSVQGMIDGFERGYDCGRGGSLRSALRAADAGDIAGLLALDPELRLALPIYGAAMDGALCAANADADNSRFLAGLALDDSETLLAMFGMAPPPAPADPPYRLRVLAQLAADGRVELGVELRGGEQVFPDVRHLPADSTAGLWRISSNVEADGETIGKIRARRLDDGRVELAFLSADGEAILPEVRYLPADMPARVWFRSGEIEVARAVALE